MTDTTNQSVRDQAEALLARIRQAGPDLETFDFNPFVHTLLALDRQIAAIWCIDDVKGIRPHLSDDQAWEVLKAVGDRHDASWGICWTTLEIVADDLFPQDPTTTDLGGRP
jgi:hypothetical protein